MSDADTVADVLREHTFATDADMLYAYQQGDVQAQTLDIGDWLRPLELTGGRVCLKVEFDDDGTWTEAFVRYRDDGRLEFISNRLVYPRECVPEDLKHHLGEAEITPVLREDTPFTDGGRDE